jgi:hypothetical protein
MVSKLTRKQTQQALETLPISHILGKAVSNGLTAKQRRFAQEVAKGSTKADAYRSAYPEPAQSTLRNDPYRLASDPRVAREIEAYQLAIEAAKHRTPAALRELVIQSLVQVVIDPDSKSSVRVAAAKVLGTVTEVAAFTERKEVRTITSSEDARNRVMGELRQLIAAGAEDATLIESQADALLAELSGGNVTNDERAEADTHPYPTPPNDEAESLSVLHTIPPKPSHIPPEVHHSPPDSEDPPVTESLWK